MRSITCIGRFLPEYMLKKKVPADLNYSSYGSFRYNKQLSIKVVFGKLHFRVRSINIIFTFPFMDSN